MRWYISAAAVRQWMAISGRGGADDGPEFDAAAKELDALSLEARLAKDVGPNQHHQQWRVAATVRGRRSRLELIVSTQPRPEGPLPQLVAVRHKGRGGGS